MNDVLDALSLATDAQRRATTPDHSAWVEANAGTGKTKVLTDRVTRLLLDGVKPERILCLTFTKAAAAEMRNRLAHQRVCSMRRAASTFSPFMPSARRC